MSGIDRREDVRIIAKLKVRFKDADSFVDEYSHNISKGGLYVRSDRPYPLGSSLELVLVIPDTDQTVTAIGKVVHVVAVGEGDEETPPGMGIEIQWIAGEGREKIQEYIKGLGGEQVPAARLDRRQHKRYQVLLRVRFGDRNALEEEYAKNISYGGIYIKTDKPKNVGERIKVLLAHPETDEEITLAGRVARTIDQEEADRIGQLPGMGITFDQYDEETKAMLEAFINSAGDKEE